MAGPQAAPGNRIKNFLRVTAYKKEPTVVVGDHPGVLYAKVLEDIADSFPSCAFIQIAHVEPPCVQAAEHRSMLLIILQDN